MEKKKGTQSQTISDELWEEIKEYSPKKQRDPNKHDRKAPGQGRPGLPARQAPEGIFCVLRTGRQWKAVPREYGCGSRIHRYFQDWQAAGFFEKTGVLDPETYNEPEGTGRERQSVDGCMIKAPPALESVGHNPTDRGKNGDKTQYFNR